MKCVDRKMYDPITMRKRATDMDERDWWIELDGRINVAKDNGFNEVKLTFDEVRAVIKLLQELDDMKK